MNDGVPDRSRAPVLVIGVGSELRRDDAAGRRVAERVSARELPDVEAMSLMQLMPELAADLVGRTLVVFVDASVEVEEVTVVEVHGSAADAAFSHHLDPPTLLALAERLGSPPAAALTVHVPATDLGLGTRLSPAAGRAVERAVDIVGDLVRQPASHAQER